MRENGCRFRSLLGAHFSCNHTNPYIQAKIRRQNAKSAESSQGRSHMECHFKVFYVIILCFTVDLCSVYWSNMESYSPWMLRKTHTKSETHTHTETERECISWDSCNFVSWNCHWTTHYIHSSFSVVGKTKNEISRCLTLLYYFGTAHNVPNESDTTERRDCNFPVRVWVCVRFREVALFVSVIYSLKFRNKQRNHWTALKWKLFANCFKCILHWNWHFVSR